MYLRALLSPLDSNINLLKENEMPNRVGILYFSPTDTTKKICTAAAIGMGAKEPRVFDMTLPDTRAAIITNTMNVTDNIDHLIVGAPVHSGKLPVQALECIRAIRGNGKTASAIVVYGNRSYGIALYSMVELLFENGFDVTAAGKFIGQHSYSDIIPVAMGRPDDSDLKKAQRFGLNSLRVSRSLNPKDISIQIDKISKSDKYKAVKPVYNVKRCVQCGKCAEKCPVGLLSFDTGRYLDQDAKKQCIGCMACVGSCMKKARTARANPIVKMVMKGILRRASTERKEPSTIVA